MEALYYEFETQESLLSYAEFMNDKIIEHEVRQACHAWILELLYHVGFLLFYKVNIQSCCF